MSRLFTFVISLVVVCAALVYATRVALGAGATPEQPATPAARRDRGGANRPRFAADQPIPGAVEEDVGSSVVERMRSGFLLIVLLTVLGILTALVLVVGGAIALTAVRSAVQ